MPYTVLPTQSTLHVVTTAEWNAVIGAVNASVQRFSETVTTLDGNGSVAPTTSPTVLLLDGVGAADVNGCTVPAANPWIMHVINVSADTATLKHEDATEPTPAKRFRLPGDTDLALALGQGVTLVYISVPVGARWVAVVAA